ncbi:hypothetical protein [Polluticoccus soli]|uniref:hypothetical protein n=1 Tax=Polluticoccus soli TaxID=3034150 RepID=UPI0023E2F50A|nr:hypothetical protein [Flavipsychrobacter sp. JY13-12]
MKNRVLLILAGITLAFACSKKTSQPDKNVKPLKPELDFSQYAEMGLDSPFIPVDTANAMIGSYLNSINGNSGNNGNTGYGQSQNIKSFIVDANALRFYLQNTNIRYVKLLMAHKLNYINKGGKNKDAGYRGDALTIVISGFDSSNNYIYSPQGAVLDFSAPCPNNCPGTGTASNDLLPPR